MLSKREGMVGEVVLVSLYVFVPTSKLRSLMLILTAVEVMMSTLSSLLNTLKNSPIGGISVPSTEEVKDAPINLATLIEKKTNEVQRLFKQRQRAREGADIAGSVLGGS